MALIIPFNAGNKYGFGYDTTTGEAGQLAKIVIAENIVKGEILSVSPAADNKYIKQTAEYDAVAIAAEAGSANGEIWAWKTGSICQVLFKDSTAAVRGYVATADAVDGRANNVDLATITGNPAIDTHFKEVGHVKESKNAGTNILVLIDFHTL